MVLFTLSRNISGRSLQTIHSNLHSIPIANIQNQTFDNMPIETIESASQPRNAQFFHTESIANGGKSDQTFSYVSIRRFWWYRSFVMRVKTNRPRSFLKWATSPTFLFWAFNSSMRPNRRLNNRAIPAPCRWSAETQCAKDWSLENKSPTTSFTEIWQIGEDTGERDQEFCSGGGDGDDRFEGDSCFRSDDIAKGSRTMGTETMTYLSTFKKKSFRFRPISKTKREFAPIPVRERMMISPAKRKEVGGLRARRLLLYYVFLPSTSKCRVSKKKTKKKLRFSFLPLFLTSPFFLASKSSLTGHPTTKHV